jgi:hypothetical protein
MISVLDDSAGDLSSATGVVAVVTNVGLWNLVINVGETKPAVGSATSPVMDLSIQASSTAATNLTLTFSDRNFALGSGNLTASLSAHIVSGAGESIQYFVYGDPSNMGNQTTKISSIVPNALPFSGVTEPLPLPLTLAVPYSLTEVVDISTCGPSSDSVDASFEALVPEPSTVALIGLGLLGGMALRRKK